MNNKRYFILIMDGLVVYLDCVNGTPFQGPIKSRMIDLLIEEIKLDIECGLREQIKEFRIEEISEVEAGWMTFVKLFGITPTDKIKLDKLKDQDDLLDDKL